MVADVIAWVCRSPRRLAACAVAVMAVILVGANLFGGPSRNDPKELSSPAPPVTAAEVPDADAFVTTAVRFVQAWSQLPKGTTKAEWHAHLEPITTEQLAKALNTTDPAALPGAAPDGEPVVRYLAQDSALIAVPLANGSSVLVTVVRDGASQRVSDVQPFAGDS